MKRKPWRPTNLDVLVAFLVVAGVMIVTAVAFAVLWEILLGGVVL